MKKLILAMLMALAMVVSLGCDSVRLGELRGQVDILQSELDVANAQLARLKAAVDSDPEASPALKQNLADAVAVAGRAKEVLDAASEALEAAESGDRVGAVLKIVTVVASIGLALLGVKYRTTSTMLSATTNAIEKLGATAKATTRTEAKALGVEPALNKLVKAKY